MAVVNKSFRIRCYPNPSQIRMLNHWFGCSRWLWNWSLESRKKAYERRKESVSGIDISRRLTKLKKLPRFEWLQKPPETPKPPTGGGGGLDLDPLLMALLRKIPKENWTADNRLRWFRTFAMNVSQVYDDDNNPVELTILLKQQANNGES